MEFVDYKCLESLLIEGEDIIATEGIGKILGSLVKGVFSLIMRAFRTIAGIFRNIATKLKSKKKIPRFPLYFPFWFAPLLCLPQSALKRKARQILPVAQELHRLPQFLW